jgi:hypothetical protein
MKFRATERVPVLLWLGNKPDVAQCKFSMKKLGKKSPPTHETSFSGRSRGDR